MTEIGDRKIDSRITTTQRHPHPQVWVRAVILAQLAIVSLFLCALRWRASVCVCAPALW